MVIPGVHELQTSEAHLGTVCTYVRYMSQETLQNPTNYVGNLRRFRKASVQLTAELQYYFHGECLPFLQSDTLLSYIRYTTVVRTEALTCSLPVLLLGQS